MPAPAHAPFRKTREKEKSLDKFPLFDIIAKVNANYEVVYIMDPALGEEAIAAMIEKFKTLVETQGTVAAIDDWGKRRLAYPINDLNEGHYVLMTFTAAPELPAELDRVLKITEGVMRSMIICKDE